MNTHRSIPWPVLSFACLILAGSACHNRSEETGAAPKREDTTSVSRADTTLAQPTTPPSTGQDTTSTSDTTGEVGVRHEPGDTTPIPPPR
jgi:hypothetical protein